MRTPAFPRADAGLPRTIPLNRAASPLAAERELVLAYREAVQRLSHKGITCQTN